MHENRVSSLPFPVYFIKFKFRMQHTHTFTTIHHITCDIFFLRNQQFVSQFIEITCIFITHASHVQIYAKKKDLFYLLLGFFAGGPS